MLNEHRIATLYLLILVAGSTAIPASSAANLPFAPTPVCNDKSQWNDPAPPMHVFGNTWYVGSCGLSAILITGPAGDVLIDGDTEQAPPMIEARIRELGFAVTDVRFIATSHAHLDHVGGVEQLRRDSGAIVLAREPDAMALTRGKGDRTDPQYLSIAGFPAVQAVRRVNDGETIAVGPLKITAHATPGHTQGSTTWTWESCEQSRCLHMVYADSLSAISDEDYRYTNERAHPGVLARFRASVELLRSLPCDILLTPHPRVSHLWQRMSSNASEPLVDSNACSRYADSAMDGLDQRVKKESAPVPRAGSVITP